MQNTADRTARAIARHLHAMSNGRLRQLIARGADMLVNTAPPAHPLSDALDPYLRSDIPATIKLATEILAARGAAA